MVSLQKIKELIRGVIGESMKYLKKNKYSSFQLQFLNTSSQLCAPEFDMTTLQGPYGSQTSL